MCASADTARPSGSRRHPSTCRSANARTLVDLEAEGTPPLQEAEGNPPLVDLRTHEKEAEGTPPLVEAEGSRR